MHKILPVFWSKICGTLPLDKMTRAWTAGARAKSQQAKYTKKRGFPLAFSFEITRSNPHQAEQCRNEPCSGKGR